MNKINPDRDIFALPHARHDAQARDGELDRLLIDTVAVLRRQARLIAAVTIAALIVAALYLAVRPSQYRATVTILVDPARTNVLQSQQIMALPAVDSGTVDSQVEILKSDAVAVNVVRRLKLTDDPEFNRASAIRKLLRPAIEFLVGPSTLTLEEQERNTADWLQRRLNVQRAGVSYVIDASFTSLDPEKAALIANTFAEVFLDQNISTRFEAARRASRWLDERSEELRVRVLKADEAVQAYRNQHNLVETGGKLLIDQQIGDLSTQLTQLRGQVAEAQARYDQIGRVLASGDLDAGNVEAAPESVLSRLRQQSADLSRREKDLEQRFGANHKLVTDTRAELRSVRRQLGEELGKMRESLRSAVDIALQKQRAGEEALAKLTEQFNASRDKEIFLRELQRDANALRQLFETFINRHKEVMQQETLPLTDARVVAPASRPTQPSNPRLTMVVLGALSGGLLLGVAGALVRDRVDRKIRRVVDAEASVGRPVIAVLPDISQAAGREQPVIEPVSVGSTQGRVLPTDLGLLRYSVTRPFSHTAEAFRRIKISLTLNEANGKAIGVTSTAPNEGKTFVSSNFAQDLARAGRRVLLIDGDLRNPTLSKTFCPDEKLGLQDILAGRAAWRDAIHTDPVTGLAFLPSRPASANENFADLFSSKAFASLMENMSAHFDKIVIDLAPIASTIDARAISQNVDGFLFVLGWGNLPRDVLERALSEAPEVHAKIKGVVLNRVDEKRIKLFDAYNASLYGYGYQYNRA